MKTIKLNALMIFVSAVSFSCAGLNRAEHNNETENEKNQITPLSDSAQQKENKICATSELPKKMRLVKDRDPNTAQLIYYVIDEKHKRVAVIHDMLFGAQSFEIRTLAGEVLAEAEVSNLAREKGIELKDCNGRIFGYVRQDIEDSFLSADVSYEIKNLEENILFKARREQESLQLFKVRNSSDSEMAHFRIERNSQRFEADIDSDIGELNKFLILATLRAYVSH